MKNIKMTKKIKSLLLLAAVLGIQGCEKFIINNNPDGVTDSQWWNTEADAKAAIGTVYAGVPGGTNGRNVMYWSGLSDEAVSRGDFKGAYDVFTRGIHDTRWTVANSIWKDDYIDIRRANRFLENVDKAYMSASLKERMKYEARALRAYYHMELMMFFGDIPLVTKSLQPTDNEKPRTPKAEVYDFVVAELRECAQNLPIGYINEDAWRISSGTAWALLSRVAMFHKDYKLVKEASYEIIQSKAYELYISPKTGGNSYEELFSYSGELNKERVFFKPQGASSAWSTFAPAGIGGETYISPTNTVVDNYETKQGKTIFELGADSLAIYRKNPNYKKNRDPRLEASILYPGEKFQNTYTLDPFFNPTDKIGQTKSTVTGYWVQKYLDPLDQQKKSGTLDFMIIRYAEVLLNYVEALVELDDELNPDVLKYINEIRNRAKMPDVQGFKYNTKSTLQTLIKRERQAELAFEGQRYFDIRRWDIVNDVMNGQVYGATNPVSGELTKVQTRSYNPARDNLWPIPDVEMNTNPNMVQNPNY